MPTSRHSLHPVSSLVSVPFQSNLDYGGGTGNAFRYTLNVQPVIPISLNNDWNLITRTILPISHYERVFSNHRTGLGDVVQSFFPHGSNEHRPVLP
jgi:hypothetical protein